MNDMTRIIAPKSDQLNSDDLIAGPRTIRIRDVDLRPGTEQPCSIFFDGDDNKPWKPCKSMSRVLVGAWGPDAKVYVDRSVTLYRDPNVTWGGMKVGGIRISHISHIEKDLVMALTATKGKKAVATIKPLKVEEGAQPDPATRFANGYQDRLQNIEDADELESYVASKAGDIERLTAKRSDLARQCAEVLDRRRSELKEGRTDAQHGDQHDGTFDEDAMAEKVRAETNALAEASPEF